jgi:hypothetical protein
VVGLEQFVSHLSHSCCGRGSSSYSLSTQWPDRRALRHSHRRHSQDGNLTETPQMLQQSADKGPLFSIGGGIYARLMASLVVHHWTAPRFPPQRGLARRHAYEWRQRRQRVSRWDCDSGAVRCLSALGISELLEESRLCLVLGRGNLSS